MSQPSSLSVGDDPASPGEPLFPEGPAGGERTVGLLEIMRVELRASRLLQAVSSAEALAENLGAILKDMPTVDAGGVYLLKATDEAFHLMMHWGLSTDFLSSANPVPLDSGRGRVVCAGDPVRVGPGTGVLDAAAEAHSVREGLRAIIVFPIVHEGEALGSLNVASRSVDAFPAEVEDAIRCIVAQVAAAFARFRMAESLKDRELNFRTMAESSRDGVMVLSGEGHTMYANARVEEMTGLSKEYVLRTPIQRWLKAGRGRDVVAWVAQLKNMSPQRNHHDALLHPSSGEPFAVEVSISPTFWGQAAALLVEIRDISWHKRLQEQVLNVATWEKQNLARSLHDGLAQQIAAAAFLCTSHRMELSSRGGMDIELVGKVERLLQDVKEQLRGISRALLPNLKVCDLAESLSRLVENTTTLFGVTCRLIQQAPLCDLTEMQAEQLYYIAQEAIMNAVRHGHPRVIAVSIAARDPDRVRLEIADDGCGFAATAVRPDAFGLHIMQYRAESLGGRLAIDSGEGRGTVIACEVPVESDKAAGQPGGNEQACSGRNTP